MSRRQRVSAAIREQREASALLPPPPQCAVAAGSGQRVVGSGYAGEMGGTVEKKSTVIVLIQHFSKTVLEDILYYT